MTSAITTIVANIKIAGACVDSNITNKANRMSTRQPHPLLSWVVTTMGFSLGGFGSGGGFGGLFMCDLLYPTWHYTEVVADNSSEGP